MTFWLNGEWCDAPAAIRIDDRGFLLGDGVFETILVRNGVPAFLDRHLARLKRGLKLLSIDAAPPDNLSAVIGELAFRNGATDGDASLRLTITRGPGERGLAFPKPEASTPTMLITLTRAGASATEERLLFQSEHIRAVSGIAAQCKTPAYLDNVLAQNAAIAAGADDAIMLNPAGNVACAAAANIFVIIDGLAATPPVSDGALPGVVRSVLLAEAASSGIAIEERSISPEALRSGAIFLTNSLVGLAPARLDGAGETRSNELFIRLDACYQKALAEDFRQAGAA